MLEFIPPQRRASERYVQRFVEEHITAALDKCAVDAINIPEIVEENYKGEPYRKSMDPLAFALALKDSLRGQEVVINKVVVHCVEGTAELKEWAAALRQNGVENVVAVGGTSSTLQYPGPTVTEANEVLRREGLCCGNIMIPERKAESGRMLEKTKAGAEFFTTQALFLPDRLLQVLRDYAALCQRSAVEPATVIVSYTPVSGLDDLDFLRWLGVDIGPEAEAMLLAKGEGGMAEASIRLAEESWSRLLAEGPPHGPVPLGLNLEYISRHNLEPALEMGQRLMGMLAE